MNKKVIGDMVIVTVMVVISIIIMMKVESGFIKNGDNLSITKTQVEQETMLLDSIKFQVEVSKNKLDSVRTLVASEQEKIKLIKEDKKFLQRLPSEKEVKKIKFN